MKYRVEEKIEKKELRPLIADLFRGKHFIGNFPPEVLSDVIVVVEKFRRQVLGRGKSIQLSSARFSAVDAAL